MTDSFSHDRSGGSNTPKTGNSDEFANFQDLTLEEEGSASAERSAPAPSQAQSQPPVYPADRQGEAGAAAPDVGPDFISGEDFIDLTMDEESMASGTRADPEAQLPEVYGGRQVAQPGAPIGGDEDSSLRRKQQDIQARAVALGAEGGVDSGKGRMGERLVAMGLISEDQLGVALQEKKITGRMLGEVLVDLGFIDEETLTAVLAESSGFEVFDPKHTIVDGDALALVDKKTAQKHYMLPISIADDTVMVAMSDPYDVLAMDTLRKLLPKGMVIKPMVTTASVLSEAIDAAYGYASSINAILKELEEFKDDQSKTDVAGLSENEVFSHPIVRLVNALVFDAVKIGASDLHFEPEENFVRLRYRVDGVLYTAQILHKKFWNGISQRLKIMSNMNIADKLSPQDGRFGLNVGGREVDFRVSSLPTVHGENIVLRVLDKSVSIMPLTGLGFSEHNMNVIRRAQEKPEGIIIVTGPTGSGKTTSLYSMLNEINTMEVNIKTLEDPVEYSLPMIRQTHVREGVLDFADGIKSILRQDPDIIFIGEIRDGTTAEMALKAAMTGHQVYTTLHTNDSFGAIPRLLDLGLKSGMVAGALIAILRNV
ncbi:MAG: Flp pilus assembly complex ATPase component TadA [Alphaproteobacteria bacterium]|nr:Flp pilus assembly complex ATPase component TadA [Alphaproteobacteria bacterium]